MGVATVLQAGSARSMVKATLGDVNCSLVCAGQWVMPGILVAADGVVTVPRAAAAVLTASEARDAKTGARLQFGEVGLGVYGMRPALAAAGLRHQ
jgi:4-hydroxy-4-methyl-2-oxoglutarate aldolase